MTANFFFNLSLSSTGKTIYFFKERKKMKIPCEKPRFLYFMAIFFSAYAMKYLYDYVYSNLKFMKFITAKYVLKWNCNLNNVRTFNVIVL